jgi:hypothetical protein
MINARILFDLQQQHLEPLVSGSVQPVFANLLKRRDEGNDGPVVICLQHPVLAQLQNRRFWQYLNI